MLWSRFGTEKRLPRSREKYTTHVFVPGHNYFKSRGVAEVSLGRLGVVVTSVTHRSTGSADGQATTVELVSRSVTELGRLVDQLIERRENII